MKFSSGIAGYLFDPFNLQVRLSAQLFLKDFAKTSHFITAHRAPGYDQKSEFIALFLDDLVLSQPVTSVGSDLVQQFKRVQFAAIR